MGSEGANLLSYYAYRKGIRASGCSKAQRYVASCTEGEKKQSMKRLLRLVPEIATSSSPDGCKL